MIVYNARFGACFTPLSIQIEVIILPEMKRQYEDYVKALVNRCYE